MMHGHGQQCGDREWGWGWAGQRRAKGENWDNCNRVTIKYFFKK